MKIIDLLKISTNKQPYAIVLRNNEIELSYKKLLHEVYRLCDQLKSVRCCPGVKVAIVFGNSIEYFISFFAISATGGTIVPLSRHMTTYEALRCIEKTDISILITDYVYGKNLSAKLDSRNKVTIVCIKYGINSLQEITIVASGPCKIDDENKDVALMVHTSGTTGAPKIVMLTDHQLISNMITYRTLMEFGGHQIVYCCLQLSHIYCICAQILTHISLGDSVVLNDKPFFVRDFLQAVDAHKITGTAFVPYMAMLLAEFPEAGRFNIKSLRYITLSGAKTPKSVYVQLSRKYHHIRFVNTYGMSEAGSRIAIAAPCPGQFPPDSVGKHMPGVGVRIIGDDGSVLLPEAIGEIEVKSSGVMKGYYRQPELTGKTIVDGWLKTGDLGKMDENGNLFIVGRKKDIIISGGENIYPAEIEECLLGHPAIIEVAVVAKHEKLLQEVPCAFIVKKQEYGQLTGVEVVKFCKEKLSNHKVPRTIKFLDELPRLGTSKVNRSILRQMADELP